MANSFIGGIISISIGIIMLANVFMTTVTSTNTSTWSSSSVAIWGVVGLAGVVGILYGTLNVFGVMYIGI